jgi:O-antigen/teichoic acid export membrane protein
MPGIGHIVARNSLFSIAAQVMLRILSFIYSIAVVRQLGDERFGQYSTVIALVGIFAVFADLGMANYAMREIAINRARAAPLFASMVVLRLGLATIMIGANVLLSMALGYEPQLVSWVMLASVGLLLYAIQGPAMVVLQGFERIDYTASYEVLNQAILITVGALLLWLGWGVPGVIIASFCGVIVSALASWRSVRRITNLSVHVEPRTWLPLLRAGLPFALITFATMVSFKVDTVLLSLWRPLAEVGWYNVAYNLIFALLTLSASFNGVLVPSLTRLRQFEPTGVREFYVRATRLLWIATLPIAVGTTLLADRLIVLLYGVEYAPAGPALRILIWVLPVLTLTSLFGSITTVFHRERSTVRINMLNAAFNIALNLWAIPRYGLLGAALMTVATEVLGLIQFTLLLRDAFPLRTFVNALLTPLLAVLVMGGMVLLLWWFPIIAIISVGAGVYAMTLLLSGGLKVAEVKLIMAAITAPFARRLTATE